MISDVISVALLSGKSVQIPASLDGPLKDSGFGVQGLGFRVWGAGFRVAVQVSGAQLNWKSYVGPNVI